jgi:SMC interacting uncharacterized protein involved in chromosome segregation
MAQTRKQLAAKINIATAQLVTHPHETRRTLNARVKATEVANTELNNALSKAHIEIDKLEARFQEMKFDTETRITELERQINGGEAE